MAATKSKHPYYDQLIKMLKSDDEQKIATAAAYFRRAGTIAAELLLVDACNRRLSVKNRVRMLTVVRKIGVPLTMRNLFRLQALMEDKSREVAVAASTIFADASPAGAAAIPMISCLTGVPFGRASRKRRRKRTPRIPGLSRGNRPKSSSQLFG